MDFIAATNNQGKMAEIRRILTGMGHTVRSQREVGIELNPEETGKTFAENALIKAKAIAALTGKPTIADDSGLCVDGLLGAPGVYSARYCGHHGDDEANNEKLLKDLLPVPAARRTAKFVSCVCVFLPYNFDRQGGHERSMICEGVCPGEIGFMRMGTNGFGYDSLFIPKFVGTGPHEGDVVPNQAKRTYAQLSANEKDAISHRGMAMRLMETDLSILLAGVVAGEPEQKIVGMLCGLSDVICVDETGAQTVFARHAQEQEQQENQEEQEDWAQP